MTTALVIIAIVALLVAAAIVYAATGPDTFRTQRTASVNAPPEKIFPLINDFRRWGLWSPYEHKDPAIKRTYGDTASGKGATYGWQGDKNVGTGSMEIVEASPPHRLVIKLDFLKPFEAHNTAEFTLQPAGGGANVTNVTWAMYGPNRFIGKVICLFINMDKMVGKDFEAGLAKLKSVAESGNA